MRGSIRWCRSTPPTDPAAPERGGRGHGAVGQPHQRDRRGVGRVVDDTVQAWPSGPVPRTRRSPPRFTHTPSAPARTSSSLTRSAARPLPIPPGSKPSPVGRRTASVDTSMSIGPRSETAGPPRHVGVARGSGAGPRRCGRTPPPRAAAAACSRRTRPTVATPRCPAPPAGWCRPRPAPMHRPLVDPCDLAGGPEPAPASLELLDPEDGDVGQAVGAAATTITWASVPMAAKWRSAAMARRGGGGRWRGGDDRVEMVETTRPWSMTVDVATALSSAVVVGAGTPSTAMTPPRPATASTLAPPRSGPARWAGCRRRRRGLATRRAGDRRAWRAPVVGVTSSCATRL